MTAPTVAAASVPVRISGTTPVPVTDGHNAPVGMTLLNRGDNGGTVLVQPGPAGQAAAVPLGPAGSLTWTDPANVPYVSLRVPGAAPETVLLTSQSAAYSNPTVVAAATAASLAASGVPQLFTSTAVYSATIAAGATSPTLDVSNFASVNLFASFPSPPAPPLLSATFAGIADGAPWPSPFTITGGPSASYYTADVRGAAGRLLMSSTSTTQYVWAYAPVGSANFDVSFDYVNLANNGTNGDVHRFWIGCAAPGSGATQNTGLTLTLDKIAGTAALQYGTSLAALTSTGSSTGFTPAIGAAWTFRLQRAAGGYFRARWWPTGTTEPAAWNLSATVASSLTGGIAWCVSCSGAGQGTGLTVTNVVVSSGVSQLSVGAVRATFTDPALTTSPTGGPWQALDPNWAPTETCFAALPVLAPQLILTNTGQSPAAVSVAGTTRTVAGVRQVGDEVGIRQLSAASLAAQANITTAPAIPLTSAAGSSLTRMNGHCQVVLALGTASAAGTLKANYVDEGGNTITQTVATAAGTFDYMHPSVPVRWTYTNQSTAQSLVSLTVAAAS